MPIDKAERDELRAMAEHVRTTPRDTLTPATATDLLGKAYGLAAEAVPALLDEVERLEREVEARPNLAEVETCHGVLRRVRSAAGLPDRYPSFAARPVDHSDGEEIATRVEAALSLLREIEWEGRDLIGRPSCPACGGLAIGPPAYGYPLKDDVPGHAPDCRLKALIG